MRVYTLLASIASKTSSSVQFRYSAISSTVGERWSSWLNITLVLFIFLDNSWILLGTLMVQPLSLKCFFYFSYYGGSGKTRKFISLIYIISIYCIYKTNRCNLIYIIIFNTSIGIFFWIISLLYIDVLLLEIPWF